MKKATIHTDGACIGNLGPRPQSNAGRAAHGSLGAKDIAVDFFQIGLGSGEQLFALAGAGACQNPED